MESIIFFKILNYFIFEYLVCYFVNITFRRKHTEKLEKIQHYNIRNNIKRLRETVLAQKSRDSL